jgi:hypothetical protein
MDMNVKNIRVSSLKYFVIEIFDAYRTNRSNSLSDSGLRTESRLADFSGDSPIKILFTGISIFLPLMV